MAVLVVGAGKPSQYHVCGVLPSRQVIESRLDNPETSSPVTIATLSTAFQAEHLFN